MQVVNSVHGRLFPRCIPSDLSQQAENQKCTFSEPFGLYKVGDGILSDIKFQFLIECIKVSSIAEYRSVLNLRKGVVMGSFLSFLLLVKLVSSRDSTNVMPPQVRSRPLIGSDLSIKSGFVLLNNARSSRRMPCPGFSSRITCAPPAPPSLFK